jgi:hypothetical protein
MIIIDDIMSEMSCCNFTNLISHFDFLVIFNSSQFQNEYLFHYLFKFLLNKE